MVWRPACSRCPKRICGADKGRARGMQQERREIGARQGWLVSLELGAQEDQGLDVILRWAVFDPAFLTRGGGASYVTARRVLASRQGGGGGGESDATLVLDIFNHHASASVSVLVLDRLPWFARILVIPSRKRAKDTTPSCTWLSDSVELFPF